VLQTAPGGETSRSVSDQRSDDLQRLGKEGAAAVYRILFREGMVRSQLVVRCQLIGAPTNVTGRSADLAFALAILMAVYSEVTDKRPGRPFPAIAALVCWTGMAPCTPSSI